MPLRLGEVMPQDLSFVTEGFVTFMLIMVALCNRAEHYIFILFLSFFLSSSFFPCLISVVGDWMFTILWHMVWP